MSTSTKVAIVIAWIAAILAIGKIIHYEGWKSGFQEGWCHAQPSHTRC
jgi:hypothetical protein